VKGLYKYGPGVMKRLFYFVITACISTGIVSYLAPSRDIALQWLPGVLGILLLVFGGRDLYLYWLTHQAQRASNRGDQKLVKKYYHKIYSLDPNGYLGKFSMGVIHCINGYWVHALASFREALRLRPHNLHTVFNISICLLRLERYKEALSYLTYLASKKPRWSFVFGAMGEAHYHLGDYSEACACLQWELFFNPGNDTARQLLALAVEARNKAA